MDKFETDVAVHQKLGDSPNVDNDMTAAELKAYYDGPAEAIKTYLNDVVVPAIEALDPETTLAVFIQAHQPSYAPCLWFTTGTEQTMRYIAADGTVTRLNPATTPADGSVTPAKLDRSYFETDADIILTDGTHYGSSLPVIPKTGQLFFKKVT